jgi:integrase
VRHSTGCVPASGRCSCAPSYRAKVWSPKDGKTIRKTFRRLADARAWRVSTQALVLRGMRAPSSQLLSEVAESWLMDAKAGVIRNRSGDAYKPSTLRSYEQALRLKLLPVLGTSPMGSISRGDLQDLVDNWLREGRGASTVRNSLVPLRSMFRRALVRGELFANPAAGLELPAVRSRRERFADPIETASLLAALTHDRPLWATALYGGLRLGELQALPWSGIDLERGLLRVNGSWDPVAGPIAPKSHAGRRVVPIPADLQHELARARCMAVPGAQLVFERPDGQPFNPNAVIGRADRAWAAAGLRRITLHECRHTYASLMIAAGVNAKALSTYMGHASVTITFDRYGHLMPGNEAEAAVLLDRYLASSRRES